MMRYVLVDTGAIYAYVTRTDVHHPAAQAFMREFVEGGGVLVLADVIFAETMTLLKARLGAQMALRVGSELRKHHSTYQWIALGQDGEEGTWEMFRQYHDKEWSYFDCALLVLARRLNIQGIFAFDGHFRQMPGIIQLPASG